MADCPEGGFNRIAGPNALPVLRRKLIESHQFLSVFVQTDGSLRILWLIRFDKQIKGLFRIGLGLRLPDVVQCLLRFRLS